jgi:hypothetical protein
MAHGVPEQEADKLAYDRLLWLWAAGNPREHRRGLCAGCGRPPSPEPFDLPDGAKVCFRTDHDCLINYGNARRRQAADALAELGVYAPETWEL